MIVLALVGIIQICLIVAVLRIHEFTEKISKTLDEINSMVADSNSPLQKYLRENYSESTTKSKNSWVCRCGKRNVGDTCVSCGTPKDKQ